MQRTASEVYTDLLLHLQCALIAGFPSLSGDSGPPPAMGIHLSGLVGSIATLPAILAVLLRKQAPLPVTLVLWHVALTGFAVSLAASNGFAAHSTSLLGKVCVCYSLSFLLNTSVVVPV